MGGNVAGWRARGWQLAVGLEDAGTGGGGGNDLIREVGKGKLGAQGSSDNRQERRRC